MIGGLALYFLIDLGYLPLSFGMNAAIMATVFGGIIMFVVCKLTPKSPYGITAIWFGKDYPEEN